MIIYKEIYENMEMKRCPRCGQNKELSEFNSNGYCKVCYSVYLKEWRKKNEGYHKQCCKRWYENNKAHAIEYRKQYYDENRGYYLYIICKNGVVQYVGATEHLNNRMSRHINYHSNIKDLMNSQNWTEIKYLDITNIVANREEMLLLENVLIELYQPSYNKVMNRIKGVDKLREFSLIAEIHDLNQCWKLYCKNKRLIQDGNLK